MTNYPIREPFNDLEYKNTQNSYKKLLLKLYDQDNSLDDDTPVSLKEIYTPLLLNKQEQAKEKEDLEIEDALRHYQFLAVSGVAGSGKSTITKFLSIATAEDGINATIEKLGKRLVLPFILRELDFNRINSWDELFNQWLTNLNRNSSKEKFTKEFFEFYIQKGWAILIFDGFDEIGIDKNKALIKWINTYIKKNALQNQESLKTNIIITGRPTGFLSSVKYDTFQKLYLQPYNQEQIKIYTNNYFSIKYAHQKNKIEEKSKIFLERLEKFDDLKQLKNRPIYLMMLAYISENKGELPKTRTLAYQQMIESYLHILDKQKELYEKQKDIELPQWDIYDKTILLEELAYKIHTKADNELKEVINNISQLHIQVSKDEVRKYLEEIIKDNRFRSIRDDESVQDILDYYLARTGLLIEPQEGFIQFSHLSFQEYLTAARIYRRQPKRKIEIYLKKELFDKLGRIGWSEISLLFYGIDTLKQGEQQSEQLQFLIDEKNPEHLKFMIKLIILTENQFSNDEIKRWFKTIIFISVNSTRLLAFNDVMRELSKLLIEEKRDNHLPLCYENMVKYLFELADRSIVKKAIYRESDLLEIVEKEDEDLAYRLQKIKGEDSLYNIFYHGYIFDEFRTTYLDKEKFKKLPNNKKFNIMLEKYIPFNKDLEVEIANKAVDMISPLFFIESNGGESLRYSSIYTTNKLFKNILKIQFLVHKNMLFLSTKIVVQDLRRLLNNIKKYDELYMYMLINTNIEANPFALAIEIRDSMYISTHHLSMSYLFSHYDKNSKLPSLLKLARNLEYRAPKKEDRKNKSLYLKSNFVNLYQSAMIFAREREMNIDITREEYQNLYHQLKTNPISYFENLGHKLDNKEKNEIIELFEKSYLLKVMEYTLDNTEYNEFDEQVVLDRFCIDLEEFIDDVEGKK